MKYLVLVIALLLLNIDVLYSKKDMMLLPVVSTGKVLFNDWQDKPYENPELSDICKFIPDYTIPYETDLFKRKKIGDDINRKAYSYLVHNNMELIEYYTLNDLQKAPEINELKVSPFKNLFEVEVLPDFSPAETLEKFYFRKYWIIEGNHLLQFSQNYISPNWYKGGVGNLNILSNQSIKVDYRKDKMQFSTLLEWNTTLYTNPNDSIRQVRIAADLLRFYSNLGFKAFTERWFYSTSLEIRTQMFNNYDEKNLQIKTSSFLSPFSINMGVLGIRYELEKKYQSNKYKWMKLSVELSPLSVKYAYIRDPEVDPLRYGIPEDKNYRFDFGSLVNATINFNINRWTSFKSRFKYFTNYEKMEIESENEMKFSINRYFSTRIYLYLRYDDSKNILRDPTLGYLQINELLSFGFNYKW